MERLIDEALDGAGNMGRYRGMTLVELRAKLEVCRKDPTMRGVTAALRMGHEQLDARGGLSFYPRAAVLTVGLLAAAAALTQALPPAFAEIAKKGTVMLAGMLVLLLWVTFTTRRERRKNVYQERMIREMVLDVVSDIAAQEEFRPKKLEHLLELNLRRMMGATKRSTPGLMAILESD